MDQEPNDIAAQTRVVVVTGVPGVGKTETVQQLIEYCPPRSALIDTDAFVAIHPWRIDDDFHDLIGANLRACIANYRRWKARMLLISGVVVPGGVYEELKTLLGDPSYSWHFYGLLANPEIIRHRLVNDTKPQDTEQRMQWLHLVEKVKQIPDIDLINTDHLSIVEVVALIARKEGLLNERTEPNPSAEKNTLRLPRATVLDTCRRVLLQAGAPLESATHVAEDLIQSELDGYASHGLLRLPEYLAAIERGRIQPNQHPEVRLLSPMTALVDGRRSFGALAADQVRRTLADILETETVAVVGLRNSNHIGRLAHIAHPLCQQGYIVIGFVNYLGAGQKMPPWGGAKGRFCTNPVVLGFPTPSSRPVVVDLTTSTVAEGKVRIAAIDGQSIPSGWLIDEAWRPVNDPQRLYLDPPTAYLTPLGDHVAGYKGYALALAVEILAGIVTGAGFVQPGTRVGGNGGLFIGLQPTLLGRSFKCVLDDIESLLTYCQSCTTAPGFETIRIPGQRDDISQPKHIVTVSPRVWNLILELDTT